MKYNQQICLFKTDIQKLDLVTNKTKITVNKFQGVVTLESVDDLFHNCILFWWRESCDWSTWSLTYNRCDISVNNCLIFMLLFNVYGMFEHHNVVRHTCTWPMYVCGSCVYLFWLKCAFIIIIKHWWWPYEFELFYTF